MVSKSNDKIPSSYSRVVARELALQERGLARLLIGTGLSTDILQPEDESYITGEQQLRILDNARRITSSHDFGLKLGRRLQPSSHGPLGQLVLGSPDMITALELLCEFLPIRLPIFNMSITASSEALACSLHLKLQTNSYQRRVLNECFAMLIQSTAESVIGRRLVEAQIELTHESPEYIACYEEYLHSPVYFGRETNTFKIPIQLATQVNVAGDSESYALAQELCQKLLEKEPKVRLSTANRVKHLLLSSSPAVSVTESHVAQALFISKRTLARRLDQEETSYRKIRESVLSDLAYHHLSESNLTVESIALLLGYSDTAAFRKAFRRWFNQSPSQFRAFHKPS
jgi:AraC-like DNA-binding protein